MSFEVELAKLEEIVNHLERGDLPLQEAMDQFQEGVTLSNKLQKELQEAEQTFAKMVDEQGMEHPFEQAPH